MEIFNFFNVWNFKGGGRIAASKALRLSHVNFELSYDGFRSHENHKTESKINFW